MAFWKTEAELENTKANTAGRRENMKWKGEGAKILIAHHCRHCGSCFPLTEAAGWVCEILDNWDFRALTVWIITWQNFDVTSCCLKWIEPSLSLCDSFIKQEKLVIGKIAKSHTSAFLTINLKLLLMKFGQIQIRALWRRERKMTFSLLKKIRWEVNRFVLNDLV